MSRHGAASGVSGPSCQRLGQALPDDLEDMDPVPAVPLHQADKRRQGVQCTEVFSSKIIHQTTGRRKRFRQSARFLRILQHSHPECTIETGPPYPRPTTSPFPCDQCHRRFGTPPIFLPMTMLDGIPEEWGNFCSGPCAKTYLHTNMNDAFLAIRDADLLETLRVVHGFKGTKIGYAPHFTQRRAYGGDLTDEQFQAIVDHPNLTTVLLQKPFCPTLEVVEWQCVAEEGEDGDAAAALLADVMGSAAPALDHHQQWTVSNLQQPSVEATVRRLASLPQQEPVVEQDAIPFNVFMEAKRAAIAAGGPGAAEAMPALAPLGSAAVKRVRKRTTTAGGGAVGKSKAGGSTGVAAPPPVATALTALTAAAAASIAAASAPPPRKRVRKTASANAGAAEPPASAAVALAPAPAAPASAAAAPAAALAAPAPAPAPAAAAPAASST